MQDTLASLIFWSLLGLTVTGSLFYLRIFLGELKYLRAVLRELGCPTFKSRDDLVRLRQFLSRRIGYDESKMHARRPLLRASAAEVLRTGYGFCGENCRVAICLLTLGGVRAHRFYVEGPRWGHVLSELCWQGEWFLFDCHRDPGILMSDDMVCRVPSPEITLLKNDDSSHNPWVDYYRVKQLHMLGLARPSKMRLPQFLSFTFEFPSLLKSLLLLALAGTLVILRAM